MQKIFKRLHETNKVNILMVFHFICLIFLFTNNIFRIIFEFIDLSFILGWSTLFLLKLNKDLDFYLMVVYSVGLSIVLLMFFGLITNQVCLYFHIPLFRFYLNLLIWTLIFVFLISVLISRNESNIQIRKLRYLDIDFILIYIILLFSTIDGSIYLNAFSNNTILLVSFICMVIYILIYFAVFLKSNSLFYRYSIATLISLATSLALFAPLSTKFITRGDSNIEYSFVRQVIKTGYWNPNGNHQYYSLLRLSFIHPIYSFYLDIPVNLEFKIIYPILYSLVIIPIYYISLEISSDHKKSFLSTLLFIFIFPYYILMSRNTRTGFAELFLALIVLTTLSINKKQSNKIALVVSELLFLVGLIWSHYGTSAILLIIFLLYFLIKKIFHREDICNYNLVRLRVFIFFIVFTFSWYIYTSDSISYYIIVSSIEKSLHFKIMPSTSYSVYAIKHHWPFSIHMVIILTGILIIELGIGSLYRLIYTKSDYDYLAFSCFLVVLSTFLPTKYFNPARLFHVLLVIFSVYSIYGLEVCLFYIFKIFKFLSRNRNIDNVIYTIFIIQIIFLFLFSSGVMSSIVFRNSDYSPNIILCKPKATKINAPEFVMNFYGREVVLPSEISSAKWLTTVMSKRFRIYTGKLWSIIFSQFLTYSSFNNLMSEIAVNISDVNHAKGYIFFRYYTMYTDKILYKMYPPRYISVKNLPIQSSDVIYSSEYSRILYHL